MNNLRALKIRNNIFNSRLEWCAHIYKLKLFPLQTVQLSGRFRYDVNGL